jgi:hypothetical protein
MIVIVKLVAMFMMLAGCVMLIKKDVINKVMDYIKEGNRVYISRRKQRIREKHHG